MLCSFHGVNVLLSKTCGVFLNSLVTQRLCLGNSFRCYVHSNIVLTFSVNQKVDGTEGRNENTACETCGGALDEISLT
jgi:hypothetical protein